MAAVNKVTTEYLFKYYQKAFPDQSPENLRQRATDQMKSKKIFAIKAEIVLR